MARTQAKQQQEEGLIIVEHKWIWKQKGGSPQLCGTAICM